MAFIGFTEDYEKYKETDEAKNNSNESSKEGTVLDSEFVDPISDEDLMIITQCGYRHDPTTVYMHPNVDYYEHYYNESENEEEKELFKEALGIRRIYKDYLKFLYACHVRDTYMEYLYEKYEGEDMFGMYRKIGIVKEWIPPIPTLSRKCEDYELYIRGDVPLMIGEFDEEYFLKRIDEYCEDLDVEGMRVVAKVLTDRLLRLNMESEFSNNRGPIIRKTQNNSISGVSVNDLQELQQLFTSWYHPENSNDNSSVNHKKNEFFKDSPEMIEREYYNEAPANVKGVLTKLINTGEIDVEPEYYDDDMIVDPKTNTPMTYKEYKKRKFINDISEFGWDSLKLMRKLGVGSSYELRLLESKQRNSRKRKKKAKALMSSVAGDDISGISTLEQLNSVLFDD